MSAAPSMTYSAYLDLDRILGAQHPRSNAHDEMLFIIQHQTSELWMRLAIHEIDAARAAIDSGAVAPAFKMLTRVARIFDQLNGAWDVLRTMTPAEYTCFRDDLGASSGFQSWQYRQIEFMLGNRDAGVISRHREIPDAVARLTAELARPSLYDCALRLAAHHGLPVPEAVLTRDLSQKYLPVEGVTDVWRQVYEAPEANWQLYELAEKLVDFEDYFRRWRFNHVTTVERIIGFKRGTGGTGGVNYLKAMLEIELFPELWHVRTAL
ncbi:MAG: tryptophan 2,3-dioxygenase [Pseudomonadota bacterium]